MQIAWENVAGDPIAEKIREPYLSYCELIGIDVAAELFLKLGSIHVYLPSGSPPTGGRVVDVIGTEATAKLMPRFGGRTHRLPVARVFLCRYLRSQGLGVSGIAVALHMSDQAVRANLRTDAERAAGGKRMPSQRQGRGLQ